MYNKELKDNEELKLQLIKLVRTEGLSISQAARTLGVAARSAQLFFQEGTEWSKEWWLGFKEPVESVRTSQHTEIKENSQIGCLLENPYKKPFIGFGNLATMKEIVDKVTSVEQLQKSPLKILVIGDTQNKPEESLEYMKWIGKYIWDKKPDVVVHIGDNYDFPSLSSYDKGKKSFEGRRLKADIEAGNTGLKYLTDEFLRDGYKPRMVFCMGNHEDRFDRLKNDMPELDGFVGTELLPLAEMGWEVYPFLKPVEIEGIFFVHYLANPMTGKPYAGTAANQLKTVGRSFVVGHKQVLDVAVRNTLDGKQQIAIINGACYPFDESYKGFQGNAHFRGLTVLHEVNDGSALPMFVSLDYLKGRYGQS